MMMICGYPESVDEGREQLYKDNISIELFTII